MSFVGIHITCSYAGANGNALEVSRQPVWSETFTSAGTTTNSAPAAGVFDDPVFAVRASIQGTGWWIAIGQPPGDPALPTTTRLFLDVGESQAIAVVSGDKVRVAPA